MLRIEMLPADNGDCLWIEYGPPHNVRRILIDGGTHATYEPLRERIKRLGEVERTFELLVVTHVDNDHIDGVVRLLQNPDLNYKFDDVWFNGWDQLRPPDSDPRGPVQGEYVAARLKHLGLRWNRHFDAGPVVVQPGVPLPRIRFAGGLELVLLSPVPSRLAKLRKEWRRVITRAEKDYPDPGSTGDWLHVLDEDSRYDPDKDRPRGLPVPDVEQLLETRYRGDNRAANGSSIAFLLEYKGARCLLAGDAHPTVLEDSVKQYLNELGLKRLPLDAFKVPHHGSKNNVSRRLLSLVDCRRYLVSTDSRSHHHPDDEAMARILAYGGQDKEILFNYRVPQTTKWDAQSLRREYDYRPRYPEAEDAGIAVTL
ncbi:MAG: MBL fold metallo-hydrolase [Anaerolineae bacterium]|nr:MBL fold metallo-hydrolase [Anaerolineae bacterium]